MNENYLDDSLKGCLVAIPESRQLDLLAQLLERRQAEVIRCPLVAILDAPEEAPVLQWIRQFIDTPPDDLILLTGEGLRRLLGCASRHQLEEDFIQALAKVRIISRGPKPGRVLKEIGLSAAMTGAQPTTEGIIETLDGLDLTNRTVAVQLYGTDPNLLLMDYLASRGVIPRTVAPYIYAPQSDGLKVKELINRLAANEVDFITFTSQPQITRLQDVAKEFQLEQQLKEGMSLTQVAAVGPIVADKLKQQGFRVDLMPEQSFFMKPLVSCIVQRFTEMGH
ncbi:MAG TPA: uroporphyrinogen III synthase HEM4 [Gammaproteobacteria bacterium]|nr:uroporphyrinogen III synthase HEM4 [Gammaproteobacteria bacterium]